ncbi:MAG: hypothetical protein K2X93_07595 [Candidatus Obscuribacterales bacterium]|nr:hypothetical protein [Candidatus Obscuribacterales bacterium]
MTKRHSSFTTSLLARRRRRGVGFTFAEVAGTSFFVIVFAALGVDTALLIFGSSINDSACRNAARAAAQGGDVSKATSLAQAAIKAHRTDGYFITQPTITMLNYETFGGVPPVNETPYVQVRTEVTVKLPVPIFFFGVTFNDNNDMVFRQMYAYPIIKTKILMPGA